MVAAEAEAPTFIALGDFGDLHRLGNQLAASACARLEDTQVVRVAPEARAFEELMQGLARLEKRHPSGVSNNCFGAIVGPSLDDFWVSYIARGKYGDSAYAEIERFEKGKAVATARLPGPLRFAAPWTSSRTLVAIGKEWGPGPLGAPLPQEPVRLIVLDRRGLATPAPLQLEKGCARSRLVDVAGLWVGSNGEVVLSGTDCESGRIALERFAAEGQAHAFVTFPVNGVGRLFDLQGQPALAIQVFDAEGDTPARGDLFRWDGASFTVVELPDHQMVLAAAQAPNGDLWVIVDGPGGDRLVYRRRAGWKRIAVPLSGYLDGLEILPAASGASYDLYLSSNSELARAHIEALGD